MGGKPFDSWAELRTRKLPIQVSDHKQLEYEANAMENTSSLASQELNFRKNFSRRLEKNFRQKLTKIPVCKHLVNYGMPIDIEELIKKNSDLCRSYPAKYLYCLCFSWRLERNVPAETSSKAYSQLWMPIDIEGRIHSANYLYCLCKFFFFAKSFRREPLFKTLQFSRQKT